MFLCVCLDECLYLCVFVCIIICIFMFCLFGWVFVFKDKPLFLSLFFWVGVHFFVCFLVGCC